MTDMADGRDARPPPQIMATIPQSAVKTPGNAGDRGLIQIDDVHKYYDLGETKVHALRGVNLRIERGEFVAIMGASGSGKSTFMNILGCLDKPTTGRYLLEGIAVSELTKKELATIRNRKIGFVFQGFNLLSRTTALENVELPTLYAQISKEEGRKRAREALELVGLGRPHGALPFPAFRRPAATGCDCARTGQSPVHPAGRRTHRKSG